MTSYLRYQKELRTVQDADDIESWITVRGNHIPVKKGQSKEDAVKSFLKNKGSSSSKTEKGSLKEVIKPDIEKKGSVSIVSKGSGKGKYKIGETVKQGKILAIQKANLSDTPYYQIEKPDGKKEWLIEEEIKKQKPESSKKWSGAWSKRANKPESLGNAAKNATSISKMTKMSASERDEEVGFPMLEIAYNDVDFSADPAKNRSALSKAIKESGHENTDLMKTVLANLSDNELKDADAVRKGIRDYMKSYKKKKATDSWHKLWGKK